MEERPAPQAPRNRRERRHMLRRRSASHDWPDFTRGMTNHERMALKKVGRAGQETKSRAQRNNNRKGEKYGGN